MSRKTPGGTRTIPILAVYRDQAVRDRIGKAIVRAGFIPLITERGVDGLEQIRSKAPALVLLDWFLPDLTGTEFEQRLAAEPEPVAATAIVFTNGWDRAAMVGQILGSTLGSTLSEDELDRVVALVESLSRHFAAPP